MRAAQAGIFALGTGSHSYLEFDLHEGAAPGSMLRLVASLRGPQATTGGVNLVVGVAPTLWATIAPEDAIPDLHNFDTNLEGVNGYSMPSTQHDLWLWIAGHAYDKVFDTTAEAIQILDPVADLAGETAGWTYKDNRDLTGFIDGTENPSLAEAPEVAIVPEGQLGAGGSVVLVQKWLQHPERWDALPVRAQEKVMGRTKLDSIELSETQMPPTAHVARTVIEENGEELPIFRRNTPYGTVTEHGTMFIGFSAHQHRLQRMLERMAGAEDGIRDALTHYTTAISGAYYFVPAVESLRRWATQESGQSGVGSQVASEG